jgi:hypothetical protein
MIKSIDQLSDRELLLLLSYLTQDLQSEAAVDPQVGPRTPEEARLAIGAVLVAAGDPAGSDTEAIVPDEPSATVMARALLRELVEDPATKDHVQALLANPPGETQMSVELAIASAVVLGATITWLQTKVKLRVRRKDGKTEFEFDLGKAAASPTLVKSVVQTLQSLLART